MPNHTLLAPVLVAGSWRPSSMTGEFQPENPALGITLPEKYPISKREEVLKALNAGAEAADALWSTEDSQIAEFLEAYAAGIDHRSGEIVEIAHTETGLPKAPRLKDVELPRTTDQLRQAARTAREGSWRRPVRDEARKIYSTFAPLGGPVVTLGPNNFPFAYNAVAGGDFAAAIASHNPVIAKAHPSHPGTTRLLAEIAFECVQKSGLHPATVQMLYHMPNETGLEMVSHRLIGATAFTGSRSGGMRLKGAADAAGKPIYLEMSSVNPVIMLEGALMERGDALADEFFNSCTMAAGQFCTNPGFVILPQSSTGQRFIQMALAKFISSTPGVLLGKSGLQHLNESVALLQQKGAIALCGGNGLPGPAYRFANTLLSVPGEVFLQNPQELQTEAFGPVALLVISKNTSETLAIIEELEGNLTGSIYTDTRGADDGEYEIIEPHLRRRVGRLINDKMPTGVAVSPAMNHGGPYPATGHPGFTAVGFPASIQRFTALHCYDNVRTERLPKSIK